MLAKAIPVSMGVACFIVAVGACSSSSGGSGTSYSLTNCPGAGIPNTPSCTSCLKSQCASALASAQSTCSSSDIECACDPSSPDSCRASQTCTGYGVVLCVTDGPCKPACSGGG